MVLKGPEGFLGFFLATFGQLLNQKFKIGPNKGHRNFQWRTWTCFNVPHLAAGGYFIFGQFLDNSSQILSLHSGPKGLGLVPSNGLLTRKCPW